MKHRAVDFLMTVTVILGVTLVVYIAYYELWAFRIIIEEIIFPPIIAGKNNDPYDEFSTFLKDDDVTNLLKTYSSSYEDKFKLSKVDIGDTNTISITFILKDTSGNKVENIASVYECIYQIFFESYKDDYMDYCLDINFQDVGEYLSIHDISLQSTDYAVYSNMCNISIADIAYSFPDTAYLKMCSDGYEVKEVSYFKNLRVIDLPRETLTSDEIEYIKLIFPMCEIYCNYIQNQ